MGLRPGRTRLFSHYSNLQPHRSSVTTPGGGGDGSSGRLILITLAFSGVVTVGKVTPDRLDVPAGVAVFIDRLELADQESLQVVDLLLGGADICLLVVAQIVELFETLHLVAAELTGGAHRLVRPETESL